MHLACPFHLQFALTEVNGIPIDRREFLFRAPPLSSRLGLAAGTCENTPANYRWEYFEQPSSPVGATEFDFEVQMGGRK